MRRRWWGRQGRRRPVRRPRGAPGACAPAPNSERPGDRSGGRAVTTSPCISSLGSSETGLILCIIFADAPQLPSKIFHFTRTRRFARAFDRCHGGHRARPAPPRAFGLKKHNSRPLVSRAGTRRACLRLRCLCARCARALVPHREHAASLADKVCRQEHVACDASAAFFVALGA